jgi:lipopolysaccharide/colanic/teichoic acid biosynthesis glycosyltransferase
MLDRDAREEELRPRRFPANGDPVRPGEERSWAPRARAPAAAFEVQPAGVPSPQAAEPPAATALWNAAQLGITALAILFLLPLMLTIGVAIWVQDRGPVFFAHRRVGQGGRAFYCLKFRSMALDAEARLRDLLATDPQAAAEWKADHKLRNDPRVTRLGAFLRKTSLDELPQLFNVMRGEMSLVGPRPIVPAEVEKYGRHFRGYCAVKPGITGLWQVSGRNDVAYRTRVALDSIYASRRNASLDLWILIRTVPAVLARRGSY